MIHNRDMIFKTSENRVCAFCRLTHRVYLKKEVSVFDGGLLLFVTGLLAYAIWGGPDLRSLLIFMSLAFCFQVFLRVRYRESLKCPHCGFDPILYKRNSEKAAERVSDFLEKRKDNPQYLLKPRPQIKPRFVSKEEKMKLEASTSKTPIAPSAEENNASIGPNESYPELNP